MLHIGYPKEFGIATSKGQDWRIVGSQPRGGGETDRETHGPGKGCHDGAVTAPDAEEARAGAAVSLARNGNRISHPEKRVM